jgi:hypothetical protein
MDSTAACGKLQHLVRDRAEGPSLAPACVRKQRFGFSYYYYFYPGGIGDLLRARRAT